MTDTRVLPAEERDLLAAELALRLLDDDEHRVARALEASDPQFGREVEGWNERIAPLFDEIAPVAPAAGVWDRIAAAIARQRAPAGNVVVLERRVGRWRAAALAMTALAAGLALVLGLRATQRVQPAPARAPQAVSRALLVASVKPENAAVMAVVSYDPTARSLVVATAALTPRRNRSYELWIVPSSGDPRSLGLIAPGDARRVDLADDLAGLLGAGATLAVSREPQGGSKTGAPTGPIVATGPLRAV